MDRKRPSTPDATDSRRQSGLAGFVRFAAQNKKWWLTPIVIGLLLVIAAIMLGGSGVAPFIYTVR
jgi:hypothetical protein